MNLHITDVDPQAEAALSLLQEAATEIRQLYADVLPANRPWPANRPLGPRDVYVVAYCDQQPVACGALREIDRITAEVRRMYVQREHRRNRIAYAVLMHLIAQAQRLGYQRLRLETGNKQTAAIALYKRFGFNRIVSFGEHANDPTSVCFELRLGTVAKGAP